MGTIYATSAEKGGITRMGKQNSSDVLSGSLWRAVPAFALTVAVTSILEQLSNLVGVAVMGQLSGPHGTIGMAALGANAPITGLVINLFVGLALGTNVVIANAVGRGDADAVSRATHTSVAMAALGIAVAVVGELAASPLLHALSVPPAAFAEALLYLRVYLLGLPAILLYNLEAAVFRGIGLTRAPLAALLVSFSVNVALDLLFVPVLGWGVAGIAAATAISYVVSALILLCMLLRRRDTIRLVPSKLRLDRATLARIVRIGLPAGLQSAVFAVANIIIQSAINSLGTEAMAASSASTSIEYPCYSLLNSFSQACTTFVGQNFGAKKIARCKHTLAVCMIEDGIVAAVAVAVLLGFGHAILGAFNGDPEVVRLGYIRFCYIFPSYAFSMVYENVSGYLRGYGISLAPALLTTISVCGIRFWWIARVFPASPSFSTVMAVYPISLCATMVLILGALVVCRPAQTLGGEKGGRLGGGSAPRTRRSGGRALAFARTRLRPRASNATC